MPAGVTPTNALTTALSGAGARRNPLGFNDLGELDIRLKGPTYSVPSPGLAPTPRRCV